MQSCDSTSPAMPLAHISKGRPKVRSELGEPSVVTEIEDRKAKRDEIAAYFKAREWQEVSAEELRAITPHYQQRISNCRMDLDMTIVNVRKSYEDALGETHRLDGSYVYRPTGPAQGRDAGSFVAPSWPSAHPVPFEQPFELRPPTGVSPSQRKASR